MYNTTNIRTSTYGTMLFYRQERCLQYVERSPPVVTMTQPRGHYTLVMSEDTVTNPSYNHNGQADGYEVPRAIM